MNIFVDTSALVKYFHEEEGTSVVTSLIDNSDNVIVVSELAHLEFISALRIIKQKAHGFSGMNASII